MSDVHRMSEFQGIDERLPRRAADTGRDSTVRRSRAEAAQALSAKGTALEELDRCDEALSVFRELIAEFGKDDEMEIREHVAYSLLRTGMMLSFLHRRTEAKAALGALLKHFAAGESAQIDEQLEVARKRYRTLLHTNPWG